MRRILLDTDLAMGTRGSDVDDGFALALALAHPEIEVELVTTVGGNSDVGTSTRLTHELLARVARTDVPVLRGADEPLDPRWRRTVAAGGAATAGRPGITALVERVMAEPGALTIVAIGPLTNVALALMIEPRVATAVEEIVVMGGVYLKQTDSLAMPAEHNFWCDPDAAAAVLASGASLRLVGLDVTEQVRLTRANTAAMRATGKTFASFAGICADEWIAQRQRARVGDEREHGSCALHDPLAVAVAADPLLVTWRAARVEVETASPLTRGVAVTDLLMREDPPRPNCQIATAVDSERFRRLFLDLIATLP